MMYSRFWDIVFVMVAGTFASPTTKFSAVRRKAERGHNLPIFRTLQQQQQQQTIREDYRLYEPYEILLILQNWTTQYQDFVQITTAQEVYGLPPVGTSDDCPFDNVGCLIYIVTLQDYRIHPIGSESSKQLPEVFLNGQVHGDERVGPTAVLEAAHLLLMAASCEAQNTLDNQTGFLTCQNELHDRGITDAHCQWLARLLRTRRIVLIPTANPWGYYHDIRTEYDVDVNRDFAFDAEDATTCMRTIAARAINEIVREHTFQSGIVFHAGFEMIGYEWGANAYNGWRSPDDTSQSQIAEAHSRYGGGWDTSPPYVYGTMDQVIYTVHGSLEDWGYASSWDTDVVTQCAPTTYGGYAAEKTVYPPYTNRMFSMLVETSMDKTPTSDFGTSLDVLNPESSGNGHVPRNVRLSLLMIDLVEPYVWFTNDNDSSSDRMNTMVPFPESSGSSCRDNVMMQVEQETTMFEVSWEVGGAFQVDSTELWYAKWDNLPDTVMDCRTQPTIANVQQYMQAGFLTGPLGGTGRFSTTGSTVFAGTISLSNFTHGDIIVILASARVDSSWSNSASPLRPQVSPQTHIANVRTNPEYFYETETNVVRGRLDWFSQPLTVKVVSSSVSTNAPTVSLSIPSSSSSRVPLSSPTDADDTTTLTPTTQQRIETPTSASNHTGGSLTILLFGLLLTYLV